MNAADLAQVATITTLAPGISLMSAEQVKALRAVATIFLDTVREAGESGAPGGVMYAACVGRLSLSQFEQIMGALVSTGKLRREGEVYFAVGTGAQRERVVAA